MFFNRTFLLLAACFFVFSCVEKERYQFTYVVEGNVKNIVGKPLEGIQVVMHRSYALWQEADTAYTNTEGNYTVYMTLSARQRMFILEYSDPSFKYRDTVKRVTFPEQREKTPLHQYYVLKESIILRSGTQVDPF